MMLETLEIWTCLDAESTEYLIAFYARHAIIVLINAGLAWLFTLHHKSRIKFVTFLHDVKPSFSQLAYLIYAKKMLNHIYVWLKIRLFNN